MARWAVVLRHSAEHAPRRCPTLRSAVATPFLFFLSALLILCISVGHAAAGQEEYRELLYQQEAAEREYQKWLAADKIPEAMAAAERLADAARRVLDASTMAGADFKTTRIATQSRLSGTLVWLARQYVNREDWDAVRRVRQRLAALQEARFGKDHWAAVDARQELAFAERLCKASRQDAHDLSRADQINPQVVVLTNQGKLQEAMPLAEEALAIRKRLLGDADPRVATSLNNLALVWEGQKDWVKAEAFYRQAWAIDERNPPLERPATAVHLRNLARVCVKRRDDSNAAVVLRQLTTMDKKIDSQRAWIAGDCDSLAGVLERLTRAHQKREEWEDAVKARAEILELREKQLGSDHWQTIDARLNLARLEKVWKLDASQRAELARATALCKQANTLAAERKDAEAIAARQEALKILVKLLGEESRDAANQNNAIGVVYDVAGDWAKARPFYERALAIRQKVLGAEHPDTAVSLNHLAVTLVSQGEYAKALPLYQQALAIRQKTLGPEHSLTALVLNNLANVYVRRGDFPRAIALYEQTISVRSRALGPEHLDTAVSLNDLAVLYQNQGDYRKALPLYEKVLAIYRKKKGLQSRHTLTTMGNLASLYVALGEDAKAAPLYEEALPVDRKLFGQEHPRTMDHLKSLASLYQRQHKHAKALPLFEELLADQRKMGGVESQDALITLGCIASVQMELRDYAKAKAFYEQALAADQRTFGPEHAQTAATLFGLATVYQAMADDAGARRYYTEALAVYEKLARSNAGFQTNVQNARVGLTDAIDRLARRQQGQEHWDEAIKLRAEALVLVQKWYGPAAWSTSLARFELFRTHESKNLTREQRAEIARAEGFRKQANQLADEGKTAAALAAAEQGLRIFEDIRGPDSPNAAHLLATVAMRFDARKDYASAAASYERALMIYRKHAEGDRDYQRLVDAASVLLAGALDHMASENEEAGNWDKVVAARTKIVVLKEKWLGSDYWQTRDARVDLARSQTAAKLAPPQRMELSRAKKLSREAEALATQAKTAMAIAAAQQSLDITTKLIGAESRDAADLLDLLGIQFRRQADFGKALSLATRAVEIRTKVLGAEHPATAQALNNRAMIYASQGDRAKAQPLMEQALATCLKVVGEEHRNTAEILNSLAGLDEDAGRYASARGRYQLALAIRKRTLGMDDADTAMSLIRLAGLYRVTADYTKALPLAEQAVAIIEKTAGPEHPRTAEALDALARIYKDQGDFAAARPRYERALKIRLKVRGREHPRTAVAMANLASLYQCQGEYARALPLLEEVLTIRNKLLGLEHPDTATALHDLGLFYKEQWNYALALPLYEQALRLREKLRGENHRETAESLNDLALLYSAMGDYARATPLLKRAVDAYQKAVGAEHPSYATGLGNLASLYAAQSDYDRAGVLYAQALDIRRKVFGSQHPFTASSLASLAGLNREAGELGKSLHLYEEVLAINDKVYGRQHARTAASLANVASAYERMGNAAKAKPLYDEVLTIREKIFGADHPATAVSLCSLARLCRSQGKDADALPLYERALAIRQKARGPDHFSTAEVLGCLAILYDDRGEPARALLCAQQSLQATERLVRLTSSVQSERQQLEMSKRLRHRLDLVLQLTIDSKQSPEAAYQRVLVWKGATTARLIELRAAQQAADPKVAGLLAELQLVSGRLAALAASSAEKQEGWRTQVEKLTKQKEQLEADLSHISAEFAVRKKADDVTPRTLGAVLPGDVALIDYIEFWRRTRDREAKTGARWQRRIAAFVIRRDHPTVLIDLGPSDIVQSAVDRWRLTLQRRLPVQPADDPAVTLRNALWRPLEKYLAGAKLALVSPDGPVNLVPIAALPGNDSAKYLVEEIPVALIPIPQLLPGLLARGAPGNSSPPSMLLVGDVDFDSRQSEPVKPPSNLVVSAGGRRPRSGASEHWPRLPATRSEVIAVADSFQQGVSDGRVRTLREGQATLSAFRHEAPKHKYLHIATHGFFAAPGLPSAWAPKPKTDDDFDFFGRQGIEGFLPGLLSGLVLAGANKPTPDDDGVLTAMEVANMDLQKTELVVLSACETGQGKVAGGEGVLGLQRAFQVAGSKSVITSLWKVDDEATRTLMERFYENYWRRQMSMLDSFREAQLWMLREGCQRGVVREDEAGAPKGPRRAPPYYWAAFVLSGDWR